MVERILIIAVPGIGDVLLSTPLITAVRRAWPEAELHVMLRHAAAGILEGNEDVDEIVDMAPRAGFLEMSRLLFPRFRKYDLIISNATSDRTTLYSLILGRRRVSTVHTRKQPWKRWVNHDWVDVDDEHWHIMVRMRNLGKAAGVEVAYDVVKPKSPDSPEVIADHLGTGWHDQPYAVIHPSASLPEKHWRREGWQSIVDHLRGRGLRVVVTGGPGEAEKSYVLDELGLGNMPVDCVVGSLRLADIAELVSGAAIYIGVDTLVSHIAAAAGAPTVVMFGPSNPMKWAPWPRDHEAELSPFNGNESQRVGNVAFIRNRAGSLDDLPEAEVLATIQSMFDESVRESPS
jgi:heptosyltransferase-3